MSDDSETEAIRSQTFAANRKGKSGGFQSMGLSPQMLKAIAHLGYKIPTPIQRKAIPLIMHSRDLVAMARTGSGKTASFVIPMLERLKTHSARVGARALILSPSRELATQTLKFVKDLGKYTDLRASVFVGGDQLEDQFTAIAGNPDIIIATPGRLMHLMIEMGMDMKTVEYVVFDEADRLFEMGFAQQLREILFRLPESRQTLLFSATLPKLLVEFARAGQQNPALIRLDVDTKISRDLQMYFFAVKPQDKDGSLLYLFHNCISKDEQTVVFVSTKHHVEYVQELLKLAGFDSTYVYGSLDQQARKIHLTQFRNGKSKILVVTDVAARGLDIPLLSNVVNYDFPVSSKVFVHRVGRTARAGQKGCAWSLVASDELAFMLDLQLFTGRPLVFASTFSNSPSSQSTCSNTGGAVSQVSDVDGSSVSDGDASGSDSDCSLQNATSDATTTSRSKKPKSAQSKALLTKRTPKLTPQSSTRNPDYTNELVYGTLPPTLLSIECETALLLVRENLSLRTFLESAKKGYQMYCKSRPVATKGSYARAKEVLGVKNIGVHPLFLDQLNKVETERIEMVHSLSSFRPPETIFEVGKRGQKSAEAMLMLKRRRDMSSKIIAAKVTRTEAVAKEIASQQSVVAKRSIEEEEDDNDEDKFAGFDSAQNALSSKHKKKKTKTDFRDKEHYMSYRPADADTEQGYAVNAKSNHPMSFAESASHATVDFTMDDPDGRGGKDQNTTVKWDPKKKKYIRQTVGADNKKIIRTEAGSIVPATFKSDRFNMWSKRTRTELPKTGDQELPEAGNLSKSAGRPNGTRVYRYNETHAPTVTSKSFSRKVAQKEASWRKQGKSVDEIKGMRRAFVEEVKELGEQKKAEAATVKGRGGAKSELKTADQIVKARREKEKRREKTGRHKHAGGGSRGRGGSSSRGSRGGSSRGSRGGGSSRGRGRK